MSETAITDPTIERQWRQLIESTSTEARALLSGTASAAAPALARHFYDGMMDDPLARGYLDHAVVDQRLRPSMERWVRELACSWDAERVREQIAVQRHVGLVHARIRLRVDLVMRGARLLKLALTRLLLDSDVATLAVRVEAAHTGQALLDMAIEVMSAQYVDAHDMATRTDEAYRSFASSLNMSLERERQRSALLDWENRLLQEVMTAPAGLELPPLGQSSFGLWVRHKAPAIFAQASELAALHECITHIDTALLPLCQREIAAGGEELRRRLRAGLGEVGQARYLVDTLFDRLVDLEAGRDALTQLLNRRFLPAVLGREVELSRRGGPSFAVLMVDVDHFKGINDSHGHESGDRVLQHLANVLVACVRSGDSVFRYGGEEFLLLVVEVNAPQALQLAEKIRQSAAGESILLTGGQRLTTTVSIGVAVHDGHPDYQRLIEQADRALYRAKAEGRNRCVLASD
ncbi:GGDEF domain-containing protein [Ideonella alba]|uniref:Diguanylate cyclase DosC n=1 Tax=Ideonella alba TaxID=2824118 RepID=A0A941BG38_9BURK|nr:GGDEF domain-containing protein [Ideonella alba]MBQ0931682.1 GGDEF domain-containing protein [Ideonella alba]